MSAAEDGNGDFFPIGEYRISIANKSKTTDIQIDVVESYAHERFLNILLMRTAKGVRRVVFAMCFVLALYLGGMILFSDRMKKVENFFLMTALPIGLLYMALMQPWTIPDGASHFLATYRISNLALGFRGEEEWMGRACDVDYYENIWRVQDSTPDKRGFINTLFAAERPVNLDDGVSAYEMVPFPTRAERMSYYSAFSYLPLAVGVCIGRLLGFDAWSTVWLARFCMFAAYVAAGYYIIRTTPVGKRIFAGAFLLPVSFMYSGGFSYDGMVLIASCGFLAAIFRLYEKQDRKKELVETAGWAFLLGAVKGGGYLILLPMVFLLYQGNRKDFLKKVCVIFGSALVSLVLFDVLLPGGQNFYQTDDSDVSFAFLHPLKYISLLFTAYRADLDELTLGMGGSRLAASEDTLPYALMAGFFFIIAIGAIYECGDRLRLRRTDRLITLATIALTLWGIPLMFINGASPDKKGIGGLQGRYYLPLFPLIQFCIAKFRLYVGSEPLQNNQTLKAEQAYYKGMAILISVSTYLIMRLYLTR